MRNSSTIAASRYGNAPAPDPTRHGIDGGAAIGSQLGIFPYFLTFMVF
jgi:hypothetical protein